MPNYHSYPDPRDTALPLPLPTPSDGTMAPSRDDDDQPRRRRKEYDRDHEREGGRERDRDRDSTTKHRSHKSPSSTTSSGKKSKRRTASKERERSERHKERDKEKEKEKDRDHAKSTDSLKSATPSERGSRRVKMSVPEMDRRSMADSDARSRTSYPNFSKQHSREAVHSKEDIGKSHISEATDLDAEKEKRRRSEPANSRTPPSPPLTADEPDVRRSGSGASMRNAADRAKADVRSGRKGSESDPKTDSVKNAKSGASLRKDARYQDSEISSMPGAFPDESERKSTPTSSYRQTVSTGSQPASVLTQNTEATEDSDATSIAPDRKAGRTPNVVPIRTSPPRTSDSQPRTPTHEEAYYAQNGKTPIIDVGSNYGSVQSMESGKTPTGYAGMPPPPPPPPMTAPSQVPRVDYLLKNGGLPYMISKKLVGESNRPQQYATYQSPAMYQAAPLEDYQKVFAPLYKRLDDFLHVMRRNGSIAVATGYRSVARRLLDKLSQIFARDISGVRCDCVTCKTMPQPYISDEEDSGLSWGEILEFVSGRRELPPWPPFAIEPDDGGLGISGAAEAPMQKIDIDVPDEYRDHYKRQNQKTKLAVQSWLSQQPELPTGPPEEADEDTLMFAMMTRLDTRQRNLFIALMHGQNTISDSRAPTPAERPATPSTALKRARRALQRLYRLERPPRDCECAMYLLHNAELHGMLATLAEVNEQEWEILISGRFDGFLWSGAENSSFPPSASQYGASMSRGPSRNQSGTPLSRNGTPFSGVSGMPPSRGTTPFSPLRNVMSPDSAAGRRDMPPSRGSTPGLMGMGLASPAPVQLDEDTEIAVLSEIERNLYTDMERLEDAFELLHGRAELVRQMVRERNAGLSMQAQMRRGNMDPGVRLGTPASGFTNFEDEDDDGMPDDMASLAPDDSASQISFNRRVRKRKERRTPAPVQEEDEDDIVAYESRKGGRRSVPRR
ncbi:hypothetical protein Q7P35_011867 [Cladosporium inversicolor]